MVRECHEFRLHSARIGPVVAWLSPISDRSEELEVYWMALRPGTLVGWLLEAAWRVGCVGVQNDTVGCVSILDDECIICCAEEY